MGVTKDCFGPLSTGSARFPLSNLTALWGKTLRRSDSHSRTVWSVIFLPSLTHTGSTKRRYPLLSKRFPCSWLTGRRSHFLQPSNFYAEVADDLKGKVVTKQKWGGESCDNAKANREKTVEQTLPRTAAPTMRPLVAVRLKCTIRTVRHVHVYAIRLSHQWVALQPVVFCFSMGRGGIV